MDLFFYGTLTIPSILLRVLETPSRTDLSFQPATAPGLTRLRVRNEDYPALVPSAVAAGLFGRELEQREGRTEGVLVSGLTWADVEKLSLFEGEDYSLGQVAVEHRGEDQDGEQRPAQVTAQTYIWKASTHVLEPELWSFEAFANDKIKISKWSATVSFPSGADGQTHPPPLTFGHAMLAHFCFAPGYINLNHGSYGSCPRSVLAYTREIQDACEACPDRFLRRTYIPLLKEARDRVARLMNVRETDSVVIVPNATHGINTIMLNLDWKKGDVLVGYSTTYGAISQTLKRTCDANPGTSLDLLPLTFPGASNASILAETEACFRRWGGRARLIVIDGIASTPGVLFPWRELAALARKYNVLSLIDGAHIIGQVPLDLSDDDACDFFVSNCHKWLFSAKGSAVMWIPKRNQHLIRTSIPTAAGYESSTYPSPEGAAPWTFSDQYVWVGTQAFDAYLSISRALDFRALCGGEERIMRWCVDLAEEGGQRLSKVLGGREIMRVGQDPLGCAMVNVELPPMAATPTYAVAKAREFWFQDFLLDRNIFAAVYLHAGRWWVRASAQIWNEVGDFERLGEVLLEACKEQQ